MDTAKAYATHEPPMCTRAVAAGGIYRSNVIRHWGERCCRDLSVERNPVLERKLSPFTLPLITDDDDDDAIRTAVGRPPSGQRRVSSCFFMSAMSVLRPPQLNTHWNLTALPVIDRDSLIGSLMHLVLLWRGCCRGRLLGPLSPFTDMDPCAFIGFAMKSRLNI